MSSTPPDTEGRRVGQVPVLAGEGPTGGELVDPHELAVVRHERVRRLLAARDRDVRERLGTVHGGPP